MGIEFDVEPGMSREEFGAEQVRLRDLRQAVSEMKLRDRAPCEDARSWLSKVTRQGMGVTQAYHECPRGTWMVWALEAAVPKSSSRWGLDWPAGAGVRVGLERLSYQFVERARQSAISALELVGAETWAPAALRSGGEVKDLDGVRALGLTAYNMMGALGALDDVMREKWPEKRTLHFAWSWARYAVRECEDLRWGGAYERQSAEEWGRVALRSMDGLSTAQYWLTAGRRADEHSGVALARTEAMHVEDAVLADLVRAEFPLGVFVRALRLGSGGGGL